MLGAAIAWLIIELQPFPQIDLGKIKERGKGYDEPWMRVGPIKIIWILVFSSILLSILFFGVKEPIFQMLFYTGFFLSIISIFSILFSQTRQKFIWQDARDSFTQTVFSTLEKHRLIKPWIEIYENRVLTLEEINKEELGSHVLAKKIKVKTSIQNSETIEFIVSNDGKEILKVLSKDNV